MGTPDFAVPTLTALIESEYEVVAVVTQPDRPSGRGKLLTPPPVRRVAEQASIAVLQPKSLKPEPVVAELAALRPDLIVVAAFGQILRPNVLALPPHGCLNVHASLLPRWRGAAPVAAAIRAGDPHTGVTIMQMDEGLDTGPILASRAIPIRPDHTGGALALELASLGADLLMETLPGWLAGQLEAQPQADELATYAPRLNKEDGQVDWRRPAQEIERQVRAFSPWPGTFTHGPRGQIKILEVEVAPDLRSGQTPGTIFEQERSVYVMTGAGALRLITVQPAGKRPMPAAAMLNGQPELRTAVLDAND
jgi:methionyl-tRNA formyltransferase